MRENRSDKPPDGLCKIARPKSGRFGVAQQAKTAIMSDYKPCSQEDGFVVEISVACSQEGSDQWFMSSWKVDYTVL